MQTVITIQNQNNISIILFLSLVKLRNGPLQKPLTYLPSQFANKNSNPMLMTECVCAVTPNRFWEPPYRVGDCKEALYEYTWYNTVDEFFNQKCSQI